MLQYMRVDLGFSICYCFALGSSQVNPVCSQAWEPLPLEVVRSLLGGLGGRDKRWLVRVMAVGSLVSGLWHPFLIRFLSDN